MFQGLDPGMKVHHLLNIRHDKFSTVIAAVSAHPNSTRRILMQLLPTLHSTVKSEGQHQALRLLPSFRSDLTRERKQVKPMALSKET